MENQCRECWKTFSKYSNLRKHIKTFHGSMLEELAPLKKSNSFKFTCEHCHKNFSHKRNLNFHQKTHGTIHNSEKKNNVKNCCMCKTFKTSSLDGLINHFASHHNVSVDSENHNFSKKEDFEHWLMSVETSTKTKYVKKRYFKRKQHVQFDYVCHRSGHFVTKSKGMRHLKTQGSNKINGFCPAGITVLIKENGVHMVKYVKTHVGHKTDIGNLFLTSEERQSIAAKIASKKPFSVILDEVRDSVSNSELERIHLLTRKDLYNIESSFNLNSSAVRHREDAISVDSWARDMQVAGTVLFYKPQETIDSTHSFLKSEDFVLIIMTDAQSDMLLKYGSDCICVDGTHGLNGYGFEMNTILVLDELRQGFPCAFLISNRNDQEVFALFFSCIKEKVGTLNPKIFMSDMAEAFFNAWIQVMAAPQYRLYCSWHVDRAWRKNLSKISTKEKQAEVYRKLRTIFQETDIFTFQIMCEEFQCQLENDQDTHLFLEYIKTNYLHKAELWAYCYRTHTGLNTNMHIERMHRTIKYLYLNGKHVNWHQFHHYF